MSYLYDLESLINLPKVVHPMNMEMSHFHCNNENESSTTTCHSINKCHNKFKNQALKSNFFMIPCIEIL